MYYYKIGYGTPEESNYIGLEHETCYTQDELTAIIADIIAELWTEEYDKEHECTSSFQHFFFRISQVLVEKKGFRPIEYQEEWVVFGWPSIMDKEDWKEYGREPLLDQLADLLAVRGIKL